MLRFLTLLRPSQKQRVANRNSARNFIILSSTPGTNRPARACVIHAAAALRTAPEVLFLKAPPAVAQPQPPVGKGPEQAARCTVCSARATHWKGGSACTVSIATRQSPGPRAGRRKETMHNFKRTSNLHQKKMVLPAGRRKHAQGRIPAHQHEEGFRYHLPLQYFAMAASESRRLIRNSGSSRISGVRVRALPSNGSSQRSCPNGPPHLVS